MSATPTTGAATSSASPTAARRCGVLDAVVGRAQERMLEPLDGDERATLHALLTRLVEHHGARFTSR